MYLEGSHHRYIELEQSGELGRPMSLTADLPGLAEKYNSRWLMTDFKAGDVMVHSPYIVHASLDNVDPSRRLRLSTDIRYQRAADPIDWRWQHHWSDDDGLSPKRPRGCAETASRVSWPRRSRTGTGCAPALRSA